MAARSDPPDAGVGGEGEPFDLSVLAPVTDREIERGVQTAFRLAGDLDARNIQVIAEGGTVTISGRVPSDLDRARAEELAFVVHGVRRVRNALSF
jgi:osmotically-inducible protein OsmY